MDRYIFTQDEKNILVAALRQYLANLRTDRDVYKSMGYLEITETVDKEMEDVRILIRKVGDL